MQGDAWFGLLIGQIFLIYAPELDSTFLSLCSFFFWLVAADHTRETESPPRMSARERERGELFVYGGGGDSDKLIHILERLFVGPPPLSFFPTRRVRIGCLFSSLATGPDDFRTILACFITRPIEAGHTPLTHTHIHL